MKFAPKHIASLASALLLLSACGQKDGETPGDGDAKALAGNGSELDTALRCWALTSSAYFQHMAMEIGAAGQKIGRAHVRTPVTL